MDFNAGLFGIAGFILIFIHFGVPAIYYYILKRKWYLASWRLKIKSDFKPKISIMIPTYNEAQLIEKKLNDVYEQDYPLNKLEIIVIDSASNDGTPNIVKEWARKHPKLELRLIEESERRGKASALNEALKFTSGDIVLITDVDAFWPCKKVLNNVAKLFSDPLVGAVSCLKIPFGKNNITLEEGYRHYYNVVRLAESKAWSTPIFHGELAAYRKDLLTKIGGFPTDIGADDSYTATVISLMGYRAITYEDVWCIEIIPEKSYHLWRVRRAQHLIQHFSKSLLLRSKSPKIFRIILYLETFLHIINPLLLVTATIFFTVSVFSQKNIVAMLILIIGLLLLIYKPYRTWVVSQIYLILALLKNFLSKELIWSKQKKGIVEDKLIT